MKIFFYGTVALAASFLILVPVSNAATLATDCTLYASPSGNDANAGTSTATPKTIYGAFSASRAGSVVCIMGGTYYLKGTLYPKSGTASAWVTYKAYGDSDANLIWNAGAGASNLNMIHLYSNTLWGGPNYVEIRGLNFDGQTIASNAIFSHNVHHVRIIGNVIKNTGSEGIGTKFTDYITADSNQITHVGYVQGWGSAISYNSTQWYDAYSGFHNYVINNVISGAYDASVHHSDGNGIIMDLSNNTYDPASANTPAALVANNVVYENGGRCIQTFTVTNIWVVNNTCYKNALDLSQPGIGEIVSNQTKNSYFVNNTAYSWNNHQPYQQFNSSGNKFYNNIYYGGSNNFTNTQLISANPLHQNPPTLDPAADGQYKNAVAPWVIGDSLNLRPTSPAKDRGIDPTTLTTDANIVTGLRQYVTSDIKKTSRPQGGAYDIGAYEIAGGDTAAPSVPVGLTAVAISPSQINLVWAASTDNTAVTGYKVFRNGTQVATVASASYSDTGLVAGTAYSYSVAAYDAAGNTSPLSASVSAVTQSPLDVTPPIISGVTVSNVTQTGAGIGWTTNEQSDSQVEYGLTTSYGMTTPLNSTMAISHSVPVTGLSASTLYHYRVKSKDAAGNLAVSSDRTFTTPPNQTSSQSLTVKISASSDDAEEYSGNSSVYLTSTDLELTQDADQYGTSGTQTIGLRFANLSIPRGAVITGAYLTFTVNNGTWTDPTNLTLRAEAADNSQTFTASAGNVTGRSKTLASVAWNNLPVWTTAGASVQSPDISSVIQDVVNRSGWVSGNALSIIISGSGHRTATAYDNGDSKAPLLTVTYSVGNSGTDTSAPSIPANLAASAVSESQINLSWSSSVDNVGVAGYKIFRNGTEVSTVAGTSYSDGGLAAGTTYSYAVAAYDAFGNTSLQSSVVAATTQPSSISTLKIGARVMTTATVNVRSKSSIGPGSKIKGTQSSGSLGTITQGPKTGSGYVWWYVSFDSGLGGWVAANYLQVQPVAWETGPLLAGALPGSAVTAISPVRVRETPSLSGTILGVIPASAMGTVLGGPANADSNTWLNAKYSNGLTGWSAAAYLSVNSSTAQNSMAIDAVREQINSLLHKVTQLTLQLQSLLGE